MCGSFGSDTVYFETLDAHIQTLHIFMCADRAINELIVRAELQTKQSTHRYQQTNPKRRELGGAIERLVSIRVLALKGCNE